MGVERGKGAQEGTKTRTITLSYVQLVECVSSRIYMKGGYSSRRKWMREEEEEEEERR